MKLTSLLFIPVILLTGCKGRQGDATENVPERISAVCISSGTPLREEPRKDGKWISSVVLGEIMTYLGETVMDSASQQEFHKVELSDGKQAWVRSYGILLNARPAAVIGMTPLYKRPDLVTKTDKSLKPIEFVAIISEKDDWAEIVGTEKRKSGWVMSNSLTSNDEDVAIATLASKELLNENGDIIEAKLSAFVANIPYENSALMLYLQDQLEKRVEDVIVGSIEEYENDN